MLVELHSIFVNISWLEAWSMMNSELKFSWENIVIMLFGCIMWKSKLRL